jgi:hypothetical protein
LLSRQWHAFFSHPQEQVLQVQVPQQLDWLLVVEVVVKSDIVVLPYDLFQRLARFS